MNLSFRSRFVIAIILFLAILALVSFFRHVLLPFILGALLAYIMAPVVDWMTQKKICGFKCPRGLAVILIYTVFLASLIVGGGYFLKQLSVEIQVLFRTIPRYAEQVNNDWIPLMQDKLEDWSAFLPKFDRIESDEEKNLLNKSKRLSTVSKKDHTPEDWAEILRSTRFEVRQTSSGFEIIPKNVTGKSSNNGVANADLEQMFHAGMKNLVDKIKDDILHLLNLGQQAVFTVLNSLFLTMITLMISAFLVIDSKGIMGYLRGLFPQFLYTSFDNFIEKLNTGLNGVIRGQLIICLVNGALTGIGLVLLDIKFALILSIISTICSLIPIFGVIISSVPIILVALTGSLMQAVLALAWILGIHFIEGNLLNPKIMGKSAEIHPVLVILALFAGEQTYGLFGILLAVPVFSILQTSFIFILEHALKPENKII